MADDNPYGFHKPVYDDDRCIVAITRPGEPPVTLTGKPVSELTETDLHELAQLISYTDGSRH